MKACPSNKNCLLIEINNKKANSLGTNCSRKRWTGWDLNPRPQLIIFLKPSLPSKEQLRKRTCDLNPIRSMLFSLHAPHPCTFKQVLRKPADEKVSKRLNT